MASAAYKSTHIFIFSASISFIFQDIKQPREHFYVCLVLTILCLLSADYSLNFTLALLLSYATFATRNSQPSTQNILIHFIIYY